MVKILLVGTGGFLGSVFRYLLSGLVYRILAAKPVFPYGTLVVNLLGCFLIGFVSGLAESRQILNPELRVLILIGLFGGFTTFSTFGYESFSLARDGELLYLFSNISFHIVFGIAAVWLGHIFSRLILRRVEWFYRKKVSS